MASSSDHEDRFTSPKDPRQLVTRAALVERIQHAVHARWPIRIRRIICVCLIATVLVMVANLILLIVSTARPTSSLGAKILYKGTYSDAATRSTVGHLFINVTSTVLLAVSYAAMQFLLAPTRANVDRAHARGRWLSIGAQGLRNFPFVERWRQALWLLLFISSIPLHLLYNSVLIQSTATNEYYALLVTQDFLHGGSINTTLLSELSISEGATGLDTLQRIQSQVTSFSNLSLSECLFAYGTPFIKDRSNVVLVTNVTTAQASGTNSSVLLSMFFDPGPEDYSYSLFYETEEGQDDDDSEIHYLEPYIEPNGMVPYLQELGNPDIFATAQVKYCLTQPAPGECTVELYQPLLGVVILANLFKCVCLVGLLMGSSAITPLVTVGDAIESFLARPDRYTQKGRAVSRVYIERHASRIQRTMPVTGSLCQNMSSQPWRNERKSWFQGLGRLHRLSLLTFSLAWLVGFAILLGISFRQPTTPLVDLQSNGFGHLYPADFLPGSLSSSLSENVLLTNLPQLLLSLFYVTANQAMTQMYSTYETSLFATQPQTLRVSNPRGAQRRSFWVGLPLLYSFPLLTSSAALHWAMSQSLFLAEVSVVSPEGMIVEGKHINAVGFSLLAMIIAYSLGAIMVLTLLVFALSRRLPRGMPVLGGCSLAIAAACHGAEGEGVVTDGVSKAVELAKAAEAGKADDIGAAVKAHEAGASRSGKAEEHGEADPGLKMSAKREVTVKAEEIDPECTDSVTPMGKSGADDPAREHRVMEEKLMYGVVAVAGDQTGRVGFSCGHVEPLRDGWYYDGIAGLHDTPGSEK